MKVIISFAAGGPLSQPRDRFARQFTGGRPALAPREAHKRLKTSNLTI